MIKTSGRPLSSSVINNTEDASSERRVSRESSPAVKPPQRPAEKSQSPDKSYNLTSESIQTDIARRKIQCIFV